MTGGGGEFLRWLNDDHFTFLGYREYELAGPTTRRAELRAIPGTGLGILRGEPKTPIEASSRRAR